MSGSMRNEELDQTIEMAANDPTFTFVALNDMGIGDERVGRLIVALRDNTFVTDIGLQSNGISADLVRALVNALKNSTTLKVLNLNGNSFGVDGARAAARFLRSNSSLTKLFLQNCDIGVEGARVLTEALPSNSSLTHLWLGGNNIGDLGASLLARSLPGNSTLIVLDLSGNGISDVGTTAMAEALPSNTSLAELWLTGNGITDVGARLLAKALLANSSVAVLALRGDIISLALTRLVNDLAQINAQASTPQEAHTLKVEWLHNLDEGGLSFLGFEEGGVEEEVRRLETVFQVGWLISSGVDGEKEEAVTLALDQLEHFPQADQRRGLFQRLLGSPRHGEEVAESVNETTARTLYRYAAECGCTPTVLMNLLRAHESLCTCRDVKQKLYPFMLLATLPEAGVGDVMELLLLDPNLVGSGICRINTDNKRKRGVAMG